MSDEIDCTKTTRAGKRLFRTFTAWILAYGDMSNNDNSDKFLELAGKANDLAREIEELCRKYDEAVEVLFTIEHIYMPDMSGSYCPMCCKRMPEHAESCKMGSVIDYFMRRNKEEKDGNK